MSSADLDVKEEMLLEIEEEDSWEKLPSVLNSPNELANSVNVQDCPNVPGELDAENVARTLENEDENFVHNNKFKQSGENVLSAELARPRFLARNVRQKKNIIRRKAEKMKEMLEDENKNFIYNVQFKRIENWPCNTVNNVATSTALVQSYTVFVFHDDRISVKDNSMAIVPALPDTPQNSAALCEKTIELDKEKRENVKYIFLAVSATRLVAKDSKEGAIKWSKEFYSAYYDTVFRYGCILMYDRGTGVNRFNTRIQPMYLVNEPARPEYANIFGKLHPNDGWMNNIEHLLFVDGANREWKNCDVPRLILKSDGTEDVVFHRERKQQSSSDAEVLLEPKVEVDECSEFFVKVEDTLCD